MQTRVTRKRRTDRKETRGKICPHFMHTLYSNGNKWHMSWPPLDLSAWRTLTTANSPAIVTHSQLCLLFCFTTCKSYSTGAMGRLHSKTHTAALFKNWQLPLAREKGEVRIKMPVERTLTVFSSGKLLYLKGKEKVIALIPVSLSNRTRKKTEKE